MTRHSSLVVQAAVSFVITLALEAALPAELDVVPSHRVVPHSHSRSPRRAAWKPCLDALRRLHRKDPSGLVGAGVRSLVRSELERDSSDIERTNAVRSILQVIGE